MDEPVVTAATPPPKVRTLAQQEADFTEEGAPPPGKVSARAASAAVVREERPAEHGADGTRAKPHDQPAAHAAGRRHR